MHACSQLEPSPCGELMIRHTESRHRECLGAYSALRRLAEPLRDIGESGEVSVGTRPISSNEQDSEVATLCVGDRRRVHALIDKHQPDQYRCEPCISLAI